MRNAVTALIVALLAVPAGVSAQGTLSTSCLRGPVDRFGAQVPSGGPLGKAAFREASRLADTLARAPLQPQSRQRNWAGRHPVLLGALLGAGIGVGIGAIERHVSDKQIDFPLEPVFGMQGAALGALVGFAFRR